jgi:hypothetical protein
VLYDGADMITRRLLPLAVLVTAIVACDGKTPEPPAPATAKAVAKAEPGDAKAAHDAKANPHAGMAGAPPTSPHGGMAMAPKAAEPGPPRDVTPSGEVTEVPLAELQVSLPKEWESSPATSPMRLAQYVIPGPGGDAELIVYRFKGGAGGVDANVQRWKGQFAAPEGKSIDDQATVEKSEVSGLSVTNVDIRGHYAAAVSPGAPEKVDKPDHRMIAAIVEGSGDPFFFKAIGPQKTLDVWSDAWKAMIGSFSK